MAKFKNLNLELKDDENINLGDSKDAKIYFHNGKLRLQDCDVHFTGAVSGGRGTSRCSAYLSANQTGVVTATYTIAELDAVLFDELGEFDTGTHRFTATQEGYYIITASLEIESLGDGNYYTVAISINGGLKATVHTELGGATTPRWNCTRIYRLLVGDYVEVSGRHSYGSDRSFGGGNSFTYLTIHRLS